MTVNLSRLLTRNRYACGDDLAVVDASGREVSHRGLDDRAHALAVGLQGLGVGRGDVVAVLATNRLEYLLTLFAVARIGGVTLPANTRLHAEELRYVLADAGAVALVADEAHRDQATAVVDAASSVRHVIAIGDDAPTAWHRFTDVEANGAGRTHPDAPVAPDDLQRILYTSGTTSRPKGVAITHGNTIANHLAQITELELTRRDRFLVSTPLYHVSALDAPGMTALYLGGSLVLTPDFDPARMLQLTAAHRATGMILPHPVIRGMIELGADPADTASVRWVVLAGVPVSEIEQLRERVFPSARMVESLGMTEYTSGIAYLDARREREKAGSAGLPVHLADVRVVDDEGRELPPDTVGEFAVRGPKVTPGYHNAPEVTEEAFVDGWFRTGDIGRIDHEGYVWFVDRKKHMIRSGGENVAAAEVERVLAQLPELADAAVVPTPHERWGEVPLAVVVPRNGMTVDEEAVIAHCRSQLAKFKCPSAVVVVDALPRNHSGKVVKRDVSALPEVRDHQRSTA
jgi:fatty-acyl-CoA synthase